MSTSAETVHHLPASPRRLRVSQPQVYSLWYLKTESVRMLIPDGTK